VQPGGAAGEKPVLLRLDAAPSQNRCPLPQAPAFLIRTDGERLTFRSLIRPKWASAIGRDHFGLWSEITIEPSRGKPVIQRLRWIAPGQSLTGGFWLFDTPCTQALWEAVMGRNWILFKNASGPLVPVSWNDVKQFFDKVNARQQGLNLVLPSKAQWEYAGRVGTEAAIRIGDGGEWCWDGTICGGDLAAKARFRCARLWG
jgi:hypothetical protein